MKTQIKYHTHTHTITWAGKMTQRVEMPVTQALRSTWWKEKTSSCKLSSDLRNCAMAHAHPPHR